MPRLVRILTWTLASTMALVTLAWTNLTAVGIGDQKLTYDDVALPRLVVAMIGITLAWLLLSILAARGNAVSWDPTWVALGLLFSWAVVSALASGEALVWLGQSERLEGVVAVGLYALCFGAGLQVGRSQSIVRRVAYAFLGGSLVLSIHGLLQFARMDPSNYSASGGDFYMGSAFASLGNPNFLAAVLVLALPVAFGLALTAHNRASRASLLAVALVLLVALYATYSQAAWLAAVIEGAIGAAWLLQRRKKPHAVRARRRVLSVSAGIVVVGVALIVLVSAIAAERGSRLWGADLPETLSGRQQLVTATLGIIADSPLVGTGPDNYLEGFRLHRPDAYASTFGSTSTNNNSHMWVLQYAATLGLPGGLALAAALALGLWRSRPRSRLHATPELSVWIWVAAVGFSVQAMFNVAMLASTLPFWLLLGAIASPHARSGTVRRQWGLAMCVAFALLLAAALIVSVPLVGADAAFMESRTAYHEKDMVRAASLADEAARLNPLSVKYVRGVAHARVARVFEAATREDVAEPELLSLYADAESALDRTVALDAEDYAAWCWRAALEFTVGIRTDNGSFAARGRASAAEAAVHDRHHEEVVPLLSGQTNDRAILSARAAPALP